MIDMNEPASNLLKNEPYKWENLYQSILRNIIRGDVSSILGVTGKNMNKANKVLLGLNNFGI